jgi:hypothetical protein
VSAVAFGLDVDRLWQTFPRRLDIEHTFRMLKQSLGRTAARPRDSASADRRTWLIIVARTQLRLVGDLRCSWERPAAPNRAAPARNRHGFRNLRPKLGEAVAQLASLRRQRRGVALCAPRTHPPC